MVRPGKAPGMLRIVAVVVGNRSTARVARLAVGRMGRNRECQQGICYPGEGSHRSHQAEELLQGGSRRRRVVLEGGRREADSRTVAREECRPEVGECRSSRCLTL